VLWGRLDLASVDKMDFLPDEAARYLLRPGDLLICEGGDIGRTALWGGQIDPCYHQNHIHRCRPRDSRADPEFYMYWMQYAFLLKRLYEGHGNQTTIANLSMSRLAAFEVALPPVAEQRAIANVLRTVRQAMDATGQVIAGARELRRSLMKRLFDSPLGWPSVRLGDQVTLQRGYDLPAKDRTPGSVPVVSSSGITGYHASARAHGPGVVIGRYGTLGVVHFIDAGPYWPLNTTLFVKEFHGNEPRFVRYFLETLGYEAHNDKTSVPGVNRNDLHSLKVSWPPRDAQPRIAGTLDVVGRKLSSEEGRRQALVTLFETLLSDLMSARIRVRISDPISAAAP